MADVPERVLRLLDAYDCSVKRQVLGDPDERTRPLAIYRVLLAELAKAYAVVEAARRIWPPGAGMWDTLRSAELVSALAALDEPTKETP